MKLLVLPFIFLSSMAICQKATFELRTNPTFVAGVYLTFDECSIYYQTYTDAFAPTNKTFAALFTQIGDTIKLNNILDEKPFIHYSDYYLLSKICGIQALIPNTSYDSITNLESQLCDRINQAEIFQEFPEFKEKNRIKMGVLRNELIEFYELGVYVTTDSTNLCEWKN